jgi:hypothetical protein
MARRQQTTTQKGGRQLEKTATGQMYAAHRSSSFSGAAGPASDREAARGRGGRHAGDMLQLYVRWRPRGNRCRAIAGQASCAHFLGSCPLQAPIMPSMGPKTWDNLPLWRKTDDDAIALQSLQGVRSPAGRGAGEPGHRETDSVPAAIRRGHAVLRRMVRAPQRLTLAAPGVQHVAEAAQHGAQLAVAVRNVLQTPAAPVTGVP